MSLRDDKKNTIQTCEDMILMAMCCEKNLEYDGFCHKNIKDTKNGLTLYSQDVGAGLPFAPMRPSSAYAFGLDSDDDRIFTVHKDYLMSHPVDIIGGESECIIFSSDSMTWIGLRKIQAKPKEIYALRPAVAWYEHHYRTYFFKGEDVYFKGVVAFTENGEFTPVKTRRHQGFVGGKREYQQAILLASLNEDSHRGNAMLASVRDAIELRFPVPIDDYQRLFIDREAPLKNGKKKAIIHWVSQHLRNKKAGDIVKVKRHTRGVSDIVIDGIKISITPNV